MNKKKRKYEHLSNEFTKGVTKTSRVPVTIKRVEDFIDLLIKEVGGSVPRTKDELGYNVKASVLGYYRHAFNILDKDKELVDKIFDIEKKAHRLALFYRTLGIIFAGLAVLGIYGIAQWLGVDNLPLSSLNISKI